MILKKDNTWPKGQKDKDRQTATLKMGDFPIVSWHHVHSSMVSKKINIKVQKLELY